MSGDIPALFVRLGDADPAHAAIAAQELLNSNAPLTGVPPPELLIALSTTWGRQEVEPVLNLAHAWSRPEMSRFCLDALHATELAEEKEPIAWLLKKVLAADHSSEAIAFVVDKDENAQTRRWLLEGVERLAFAGSLGWEQLSDVVEALSTEPHPVLRAGLAPLLMALPWRPENTRLLEPLLLDPDYEVSSAAAHTLAGHPAAVRELKPEVLDHLATHPNPMMRHSAAELAKARSQED